MCAYLSGESHPNWKGGKTLRNGYWSLRVNNTLQYEHRMIWEQAYGPIPDGYVIHHRNGIRTDNRLSNLQMITQSEHMQIHAELRDRWSRAHDCCVECGTTEQPHRAKGICRRCYSRAQYQRRKLRDGISDPGKLTEDDVREIRRLAAAGVNQYEIASQFEIHQSAVSRIVSRKRWAHVT